jgi:hypothetical protein
VMGIIGKIRVTIHTARAFAASGRGDSEATFRHLTRAESAGGKLPAEYMVLKVWSLIESGDPELLRNTVDQAKLRILDDPTLAAEDKGYLRACLWSLCKEREDVFDAKARKELCFSAEQVDLSKVSAWNIRLLSLLEHPDWGVERVRRNMVR